MVICILLYVLTTALGSAISTSICAIDEQRDCTYSITCQYHPGTVTNFNCIYLPNVTFIITDSTTSTLTSAFFGATNFDARVRQIKAVNNSWNVIDALSFRYYSRVRSIDLTGNQIHDIRKDAFRNLMDMDKLNLSRNAIDTLHPKCFFIGDSSEPDLYELDLSFNQIRNITEPIFSNLAKLKTLYLNNNKLYYISDDVFIDSCKALKNLYLHNNFLASLNTTLINMKNLEVLNLSYNLMKMLKGYEVNRLTSIKKMNMSHNLISDVASNCFSQAVLLESLDFSHNKIISSIKNSTFIKNDKLKYLNFYNNSITTIEDNSFSKNALEYLNLEHNFLTGVIKTALFSGVKDIITLKLYKQEIVAIEDYAFKDMTNLSSLNLSQNSINTIQSKSFENLHSLKILDLSKNKISNLLFLNTTLRNITELNLNNNNLSVIPAYAFVNQKIIVKLDLSKNSIFKVEPYALPLKTLQYINLDENIIIGTIKKYTFSPAEALRYYDFTKFNVTKIDNGSFIDLPLLARLNLSHNQINMIESNNFINMNNAYSLDLSFNNLSNISLPFSNLLNLKSLYLSNNRLTEFAHAIFNITSLQYLDLSNNDIKDITTVSFNDTPNLQVILLSHNKISYFNSPQTNALNALVDLNLSHNFITNIDLSFFKNIAQVSLSCNNLTSINNREIQNLNYLQLLDISGNRLTEIIPGTFRDMKILTYINISDNSLEELHYGCFKGLHMTELMDISRNNIKDIDVDLFHVCTELRKLIVDYNQLKSFDVERLGSILPKLNSISLGGNPLSCKEIVQNIKNNHVTSLRRIEVTSVDKVYHEDNVNGIQCGDTVIRTTATPVVFRSDTSGSNAVLICFVGLLLVVALGAAVYYFNRFYSSSGVSRVQLRNSVELSNNSESHVDLLS